MPRIVLTVATGSSTGTEINLDTVARFYLNFTMPEANPVQRVGKEEAVLGLEPLATISELRRAYRRLARANHPDLGPEDEREARTKRMADLNIAYRAALQRRGH